MLHGSKRILLFDDAGYLARMKTLFGSSLIGYWPGGEPNGAVALDYSGLGFHGAYTGVTLGQQGAGDGLTCPLYDGANDFMQPPAGFRTAFTPAEFSILIWSRVSSSAIWTDGLFHHQVRFAVDGNNLVRIDKANANNNLQFVYIAGATTKIVTAGSQSTTEFQHLGITVSVSGDAVKAYIGGVQSGATQTGLGTWVGALSATNTVFGAQTTVPNLPWDGYLAHCLVLNRAATPAEVAAASVI